MKVGFVGLGLIGGSMAKAYREYSNEGSLSYELYGYDRDASILSFAMLDGTLNGELTDENIKKCDLIFIALYPVASVEYLKNKSHLFGHDTVIIDLC